MTVSNVRRMLETSEVEGGGSATAIESRNASAVESLEEGGGGALYSRAFRASSHLSSPLPKEGDTYRSYDMNRLRRRKLL